MVYHQDPYQICSSLKPEIFETENILYEEQKLPKSVHANILLTSDLVTLVASKCRTCPRSDVYIGKRVRRQQLTIFFLNFEQEISVRLR